MKKNIIITTIILSIASSLYCTDILNIFEEFKNQFQKDYVSPFNKDLTGVICSGIFNNADNLGLFAALPPSIGVNLKVNVVAKEISDDDEILKNIFKGQNVKLLPLVSLQVEKGLPYGIDLIGRYFTYSNYSFWSAGIKYKFLSLPPLVPVVNISFAGIYNSLVAKDVLTHTSQSLNLIVSVEKIPMLKPYVVVGIDSSELNIDKKILEMKDKFSSSPRYEVGLNFSFVPVVYVNIGYLLVYNTEGYVLSLGARF